MWSPASLLGSWEDSIWWWALKSPPMNRLSPDALAKSSSRLSVPSCCLYMLYIEIWFCRSWILMARVSTPSPQGIGLFIFSAGMVFFTKVMSPLVPWLSDGILKEV